MSDPSLHTALDLVASVIERRATIPILSNILIEVEGGCLRLTATDLDMEISVAVAAEGPAFRATVDGAIFQRVAKTVGADGLHMDGKKLVVGSGPTFTLDTLPADDFPCIRPIEPTTTLEIPSADLSAVFDATAPAICREETRYYLNGINVEARDGKVTFFATDGHRLHMIEREAPDGLGEVAQAIIPRKAVKLVRAALESLPDQSVTIGFEKLKAEVKVGPVTVKLKLIDGTYPDVRRVIPSAPSGSLAVAADELLAAVNAATLIAPDSSPQVSLDFRSGMVSAKQIGVGTMTAELPGNREGKVPDVIGFDAHYLRAICERFGGLQFKVGVNDASGPVLFTSASSPLTAVLMPVRLA